jgi:hypothetical protein
LVIAAEIERIIKEGEERASGIDKMLRAMSVDRAAPEALRVIAAELVLVRAELAALRAAVAGGGKILPGQRQRGSKKPQKSPGDSAAVTYYVAIQFVRRADGSLVAQRPLECADADAAIAGAKTMMRDGAVGAVAFSRSGNSDRGEFDPAVILGSFGDVPDDISELE